MKFQEYNFITIKPSLYTHKSLKFTNNPKTGFKILYYIKKYSLNAPQMKPLNMPQRKM